MLYQLCYNNYNQNSPVYNSVSMTIVNSRYNLLEKLSSLRFIQLIKRVVLNIKYADNGNLSVIVPLQRLMDRSLIGLTYPSFFDDVVEELPSGHIFHDHEDVGRVSDNFIPDRTFDQLMDITESTKLTS